MAYDLHGTWDLGSKWLLPVLNSHTNLTGITESLDLLWRNDISPSKVVLGLAFYGRVFTASSSSCLSPGCSFASGGLKGPCSHETGFLLNSEIVDIVASKALTPVLDKNAAVKMVSWDDQWVTYDDVDTLNMKVDFARGQCLGGVMVWAISHDLKTGNFSRALATATTHYTVQQQTTDSGEKNTTTVRDRHNQCKWTNCSGDCQPGFAWVARSDSDARTDESMTDNTACDGFGTRKLCCPTDTGDAMPTCGWYGFNNGGGKCSGKCGSGMVEVGSNNQYCGANDAAYEAACCTTGTKMTALYEQCGWTLCGQDTAGFCSSAGFTGFGSAYIVSQSSSGSGGSDCPYQGYDSIAKQDVYDNHLYCCSAPINENKRWSNCEEGPKGLIFAYGRDPDKFCFSGCAGEKVRVSLETRNYGCAQEGGGKSICCDDDYFTITEVEDPDLKTLRLAMDAWAAKPICTRVEAVSKKRSYFDGNDSNASDLIQFESQIEVRAAPTPEHSIDSLIFLILANSDPPKFSFMKDLWNAWVTKHGYTSLTVDSIRSFMKSYAPYKLLGPVSMSKKILCNLQTYNTIIHEGAINKTLTCTPLLLIAADDTLNFDDETGESIASITQRRQALSNLVDRDLEQYGEIDNRANGAARIFNLRLLDDAGNVHNFSITSQPYPNGRRGLALLELTNSNERYSITSTDCGSAVIEDTATAEEIASSQWVTEHILELQLIGRFIELIVNGQTPTRLGVPPIILPTGISRVPYHVITQFFAATYESWWATGVTGSPMEDVFNALGSVSNPGHLVVAESTLNAFKARANQYNDFISSTNWGRLTSSYERPEAEAALGAIRTAIATVNYINDRRINGHLTDAYLQSATVWGTYSDRMNSLLARPNMFGFQELWTHFMRQHMTSVVYHTRVWVQAHIADLRQMWQAVIDLAAGGTPVTDEELDIAYDIVANLQLLQLEWAALDFDVKSAFP